jgi:hypothetical protein
LRILRLFSESAFRIRGAGRVVPGFSIGRDKLFLLTNIENRNDRRRGAILADAERLISSDPELGVVSGEIRLKYSGSIMGIAGIDIGLIGGSGLSPTISIEVADTLSRAPAPSVPKRTTRSKSSVNLDSRARLRAISSRSSVVSGSDISLSLLSLRVGPRTMGPASSVEISWVFSLPGRRLDFGGGVGGG